MLGKNDRSSFEPGDELDLSKAPSTLFFFGLAGCGKSYVARLVAALAGWTVYDADDDLTDELKLALAERRRFTEAMRDRFFAIVADRILDLQSRHEKLVVSQAVYKRRHRNFLMATVPNFELICVEASESVTNQRLSRRRDGIGNQSAAALRRDFELPGGEFKLVINDSDDVAIIRQLNRHFP